MRFRIAPWISPDVPPVPVLGSPRRALTERPEVLGAPRQRLEGAQSRAPDLGRVKPRIRALIEPFDAAVGRPGVIERGSLASHRISYRLSHSDAPSLEHHTREPGREDARCGGRE
jgi:hypothetical protein